MKLAKLIIIGSEVLGANIHYISATLQKSIWLKGYSNYYIIIQLSLPLHSSKDGGFYLVISVGPCNNLTRLY